MGGLMAPDSGALQVLDLDVVAQPQAVAENLDLYADLHGIDAAERARQYPRLLEMTALAPFTKRHNRQRHLGFLPQDHVCERQTTMARTLRPEGRFRGKADVRGHGARWPRVVKATARVGLSV